MNYTAEEAPQGVTGGRSPLLGVCSRRMFSLLLLLLIVFLPLEMAVHACVVWGLSLLTLLSYLVARDRKEKPLSSIIEHLLIAGTVITASHYVGRFLADKF